ncbi:MAG TPA: SDR family NAD(P)-dependent oxidoreductase [Verrucomicrobiae bacterium]|nr:SDR family NAD(P)-dependent oxidoreductase [Verrucomicrobiae bacterium]
MTKTSVVTGAGSGVGQAVALELAKQGWRVAILGRRPEALAETLKLAGALGKELLEYPCDIGDPAAVERMAKTVLTAFGSVELLVNAAGTNVPHRSLEVLSLPDYHAIVNANLHGSYYCAQAFLPGMRKRGSGTIINIVSVAGKQASSKSGPAYVVSKFGQAGLTQAINAEERINGIRACSIFPGDINTPILDKRPAPPPPEAREKMLMPEDVAACVLFVANLPARAVVEEMMLQPL